MCGTLGLDVKYEIMVPGSLLLASTVTGPGSAIAALAVGTELLMAISKAGVDSVTLVSAIFYTCTEGGFSYETHSIVNEIPIFENVLGITFVGPPIKE